MAEKYLNECPDLPPFEHYNIDKPPETCDPCQEPTQKYVNPFFDDLVHQKKGLGQEALCDPEQTGAIFNDLTRTPSRNTIYRYSKAGRGCDEAMVDLFRSLVVIDERAVSHPVPILWATQERAVAAVLQTNVRKDTSLVVDRVRLPMLAIYSNSFAFNQNRYTYHKAINYFNQTRTGKPLFLLSEKRKNDTVLGFTRGIPIDIGYQLTAWTLYVEDMNQILEQIWTKFSPIAYIRVQGVQWEIGVKLDSIESNLDTEPGDSALRVVKFQFNMTAETYIPQPIHREKTVLSEQLQFANSVREDEIVEILSRFEIDARDGER